MSLAVEEVVMEPALALMVEAAEVLEVLEHLLVHHPDVTQQVPVH